MYASRPYLELIRQYPMDVRYNFIVPKVANENELWALYINDDFQYDYKVVTKTGDDYSYQDNGTAKMLLKKANNTGGYNYSIDVDGKKRTVLIEKAMETRNGFPKYFIIKASGQEGQTHLLSPVIL